MIKILNDYIIEGNISSIACFKQGTEELFYVTIDLSDFELVSSINGRWYVKDGSSKTMYAYATFKGKTSAMHNIIMDPPTGMVTDHIQTEDGLNNVRSNLRVVTGRENAWNRSYSNPTNERCIQTAPNGRFRVRIGIGSKQVKQIGTYDTIEQAVQARDCFLIEGIL